MKLFNLIKENLSNKQQSKIIRWEKWDRLKQKIMDKNFITQDDLDEDPSLEDEINKLTEKAYEKLGKSRLNEDDPCWDGYEQYGMKEKDGKQVPNCIKK